MTADEAPRLAVDRHVENGKRREGLAAGDLQLAVDAPVPELCLPPRHRAVDAARDEGDGRAVRDGCVDPVALAGPRADGRRLDVALEHVGGLKRSECDEGRSGGRDRDARCAPGEQDDGEHGERGSELEERRVGETEPGGSLRQRGPEGRRRRGPEDDRVLVGRELEQGDHGRSRADGGDELRSHVRPQDEPRGAPDREERDEVEEVPVLDELPRREAEIERGDLKDQQRDEREQERCKGVRVTPATVDRGRPEPRGREHDRDDSDAEGDLVEMLEGGTPQAVRHEIALERYDVVADDVP